MNEQAPGPSRGLLLALYVCYSLRMDIKCGHCGGRHGSVAEVRACAGHVDRPAPVAKPGPATVGMYRKAGQIYKVDRTSRGHLFAKLATVGQDEIGRTVVSYSAAKGMVARLTQADRMDTDEAAAFGRLTGTCIRCGALLEDPASVEAGIGPVCAKKI